MAKGDRYDVAVIGGGTMGSAAAWALVKQGLRPVVLEQFGVVHDFGSHSGDTRIFRHAYAESPDYVPLVLRADDLWQELASATGEEILNRCGGLELAAPGFPHARAAREAADIHGLSYEWLTPADARQRWPQITIPDEWDVLYSDASGFLNVAPAIRGMMGLAEQGGATIRTGAPVTAWGDAGDHVWIETPQGRVEASAAIVTAGAWAAQLLRELGLPLHVRRKTLWWQRLRQPERHTPDKLPVFITDSAIGGIYGFPSVDGASLKIANHLEGDPVEPDAVDRTTHEGENADVLALAATLFPDVTPEVVKSAVCLYMMTPDTDFILDRHPTLPNVALGAGFSGHGFK
ncbi:MAG: N-methyl-L-tryptophan oxidase, partial [Thermomicrobiales bacterium]|nr:N-methyl-L-tryptophan oxidase [Thermomicrobiales bacterium]